MINNLQALRAFAALNVVLFHAIGTASAYGYESKFLSFLNGWGANGVDIFFVISGFIMVLIQSHSPKTPYIFIKNRLIRIAPLYLTLTILIVILLYVSSNMRPLEKFEWSHLFTSVLFISHFFDYAYPIISPGWTLELEVMFYSIFAICILFARANTAILTSLALILLISLQVINTLALEFIYGMLIGKVYLKGYLSSKYVTLFTIGCAGLIFSLFFNLDINRVIVWGIPSTLLVLSCCYLPQIQNRILILIGNASYSIYLIHTLIISYFFKVILLSKLPNDVPDLYVIFSLTLSILAGCSLYYLYEKPLTKFLKRY